MSLSDLLRQDRTRVTLMEEAISELEREAQAIERSMMERILARHMAAGLTRSEAQKLVQASLRQSEVPTSFTLPAFDDL